MSTATSPPHGCVSAGMRAWRATVSEVNDKSLAIEHFAFPLNDFLAVREEQVLWPRTAATS